MIDWNKTAFLFPGQGSQVVGMGADIAMHYPVAKAVFDEADKILGLPFSQICFEGPEEELNDTYNTQPALYIASLAILKALSHELDDAMQLPAMIAGHSLGEITALVAAESISFEDGLLLVRERGRLMKEAGEKSPGAMAAILGLEVATLQQICDTAAEATGEPLVIANDNCPGQVVISGGEKALDHALPIAKEQGARHAMKLAVSVAAHSPLMSHSAEEFRQIVENTPIEPPKVPVIGNATATIMPDVTQIRDELSGQLTSPVRWTETIQLMLNSNITTFIELGPKGVLKGLLRRIDRSAIGIGLEATADIQAILET